MIFEVTTTKSVYCTEEKNKIEKLGFILEAVDWKSPTCKDGLPLYLMKGDESRIEINTLDDLVTLGKEYGDLIINFERNSIEIYNDYRE